jgi:hypothetical protein
MTDHQKELQQQRMAEQVGNHVARFTANYPSRVEAVTIFPNVERESESKSGWMEWLIKYVYKDGGGLTVGAILRTPDQERVEFHS